MTVQNTPTIARSEPFATSVARYDGAMPDDLLAHCADHIRGYDVPVDCDDTALSTELRGTCIHMQRDAAGFSVHLAAPDGLQLYNARESVAYLLDHVLPGATAALRWTGMVERDMRPPNFHEARVLSVRRVAPRFLRVTLACAGTPALMRGGMHFSLLLPPDGRDPRWPHINANGRTIWAEGADALHRAAYTFVDLDPAAGTFSFDILEHDGGRTTEWARGNPVGQGVGITGPGGGDFPAGDHLLIAGDETALPAIRRILAHSPAERTGAVLIEVGYEEDICVLSGPRHMPVTWLRRDRGETLASRLTAAAVPDAGASRFVWVAAELAVARAAKAHFRNKGLGRSEGYFSGYWSAGRAT